MLHLIVWPFCCNFNSVLFLFLFFLSLSSFIRNFILCSMCVVHLFFHFTDSISPLRRNQFCFCCSLFFFFFSVPHRLHLSPFIRSVLHSIVFTVNIVFKLAVNAYHNLSHWAWLFVWCVYICNVQSMHCAFIYPKFALCLLDFISSF